MTIQMTTRNADLNDLADLLRRQHDAKLDVVVPATAIRSISGIWHVDGTDTVLSDEGVTRVSSAFVPTVQADEHVAGALKIPLAYVRRMREVRPDLYDANVNGWLHGDQLNNGPDPRSFLVRTFRGDPGIARALLSSRFKMIDHLDVLVAALDGVRQAGVNVQIDGCDLTERRMYVRLIAPEVQALAPILLRGYRSPFDSRPADELPVVFAGLQISNSETGGGALNIAPRMVVQVCKNGMTRQMDAVRAVHLGGKLDDGIVDWSEDTQQRQLQLITAKTADAVRTFLDVNYVAKVIDELEGKATKSLADPAAVVEVVTRRLSMPESLQATVLDHFIRGGQPTAGGLGQAVSSMARTLTNADEAAEWESRIFETVDLAASI